MSKIFGYYPRYESIACKWGISNEAVARKIYIRKMKKFHIHLCVTEPGFFIDIEYPFIGASPDGLVSYRCHGPGLLEIKCPWTYRALNVTEYATKKYACLELIDNNIKLKRTHTFYFQVQCQMHATNRKWCDFFLCTTKDSFLERIIFDGNIFAVSVAKATYFLYMFVINYVLS